MSTLDDDVRPCYTCGMMVSTDDYHPYAACLMFQSCHCSETVQANLDAVQAHGYQQALDDEADKRVI